MNLPANHFHLDDFISKYVTRRVESLLRQDWLAHEKNLGALLKSKSVLVIGGAGTIGSAFIKCLLNFELSRLYVVDVNENGLAELVRDVRSSVDLAIPEIFKTCPFDFGDPVFEKFFRQEGPFEIVANFAAHKHVRSEKDLYAIEAMVRNNVFKTRQLLELLFEFPPERFFCVSTDKASEPANIMGATKQLMEQVLLAYSDKIHLSTARFANVAFSSGSLPAAFLERLMKQQPLSAPQDVARYFVSPSEAGELCLLACMLGESGDIFFPKLDPETDTCKFSDIAVSLLDCLGLEPEFCRSEQEAREKAASMPPSTFQWPVYFFQTDTSGEKQQEQFYSAKDRVDWRRFHRLGVLNLENKPTKTDLNIQLSQLESFFEQPRNSKAVLTALLEQLIPGFHHWETGKNLDEKM